MSEVNPISDRQVSLFAIDDYTDASAAHWGWLDVDNSELGTKKFLVPNSPNSELGTKEISVPNSGGNGNGGGKILVPNSDEWKPPVGCLQQKWIKDIKYWYWRYYDNRRKKRSLYLGRDYNKAIRKAQKIGIPPDAKLPNSHPPQTDP
jgi:hypothetical protein